MKLFNFKAANAMEITQKQIDQIDTAIVIHRAVSIYCRASGKESPFTKQQLAVIVKEVAEIKWRDKVSLRRALDGYRATHANDPRFAVFEANKLKHWHRKVRARPKVLRASSASLKLRGDVS